MVKITIDYHKCEGADVCPMEVIVIEGDTLVIKNKDECSFCEVCMDVCPDGAIEVEDS